MSIDHVKNLRDMTPFLDSDREVLDAAALYLAQVEKERDALMPAWRGCDSCIPCCSVEVEAERRVRPCGLTVETPV